MNNMEKKMWFERALVTKKHTNYGLDMMWYICSWGGGSFLDDKSNKSMNTNNGKIFKN
jgi:hypothetical protein